MIRKVVSRRDRATMRQVTTLGTMGSELLGFNNMDALHEDYDPSAPPTKKQKTGKSFKGKGKGKAKGKKGNSDFRNMSCSSTVRATVYLSTSCRVFFTLQHSVLNTTSSMHHDPSTFLQTPLRHSFHICTTRFIVPLYTRAFCTFIPTHLI